MIIAPEIILFNTIKGVLSLVRSDWENKSDKSKTILGIIWGDLAIERYKFIEQGEAVFNGKQDNPRRLDVNMFFNASRSPIPTIHITLPSEDHHLDGLGMDEGYQDSIGLDDDTRDDYTETFTRRYKSNYSLIVTSDNANEVSLISRTIHALCQSLIPHFTLVGLENVKLGFRDIQLNNSLVPKHIFARSINIAFEYENTTPNVINTEKLSDIIFKQSDIILNNVKYETNG